MRTDAELPRGTQRIPKRRGRRTGSMGRMGSTLSVCVCKSVLMKIPGIYMANYSKKCIVVNVLNTYT